MRGARALTPWHKAVTLHPAQPTFEVFPAELLAFLAVPICQYAFEDQTVVRLAPVDQDIIPNGEEGGDGFDLAAVEVTKKLDEVVQSVGASAKERAE
jgi:hypothetical protein